MSLQNPVQEIRKVADFIECGATDEDVEEVARNTTFDVMKAAEIKRNGDDVQMNEKGDTVSSNY